MGWSGMISGSHDVHSIKEGHLRRFWPAKPLCRRLATSNIKYMVLRVTPKKRQALPASAMKVHANCCGAPPTSPQITDFKPQKRPKVKNNFGNWGFCNIFVSLKKPCVPEPRPASPHDKACARLHHADQDRNYNLNNK